MLNTHRGFAVTLLLVLVGLAVIAGGAYFMFHASSPSSPALTENTTQTPQGAPAAQNLSGASQAGSSGRSSQPDSHILSLMNEVGCSDQSSCVAACTKSGMTPACAELQSFMASNESAYTQGSPSGQPAGDVAFVGNNTPANAGALPACPSDNALLDAYPIHAADLTGIEPMGHMNGEHILPSQADHVYLYGNASAPTTVYAPGNATLLAVAESIGIAGADKGSGTVKIYFSPCKSVMFALQMTALSSQLMQALAALKPANVQAGATVQNTTYGPLSIPLTSGEAIGTIAPFKGQPGGVDFAVADVRTAPLPYIDQQEATGMLGDSYLHTACPLDYFSHDLKSALYGKLTIRNAGANGIPACGSTMQDKAGTSQGNWYHRSATAPSYQGIDESSLLAIAHYNFDPAQGIISVGTALIPSSYLGTQIIFTPTHAGAVNREPGEITPDGKVYCFDGPMGAGGHGSEGHIDIRLASATQLEADYGSGACATNPTLLSPVAYQR
ncbi:MAG: hypothetical protein KGI60_04900 [Patescibacteria group bacterium]|nr:hypothetical protein [Patescibacteria group bacterium]